MIEHIVEALGMKPEEVIETLEWAQEILFVFAEEAEKAEEVEDYWLGRKASEASEVIARVIERLRAEASRG